MGIRILTDTSSGITNQEAKDLKIDMARMPIIFGDEEFIDGETIQLDEFYDRMENRGQMPKTALVNKQIFLEIFEDVKNKNEEMVVFLISQHLSATHENAVKALEEINYDKIHIIDTLLTTTPLAALVFEAVKLRDAKKSAKEILENCNELKTKVKVYAMVRTLKYLVAGGRLSKASGAIGGMLNLKPIISISDGKIANVHKSIGLKSAFSFISQKFKTADVDKSKPVYFCNTNNVKESLEFKNSLKDEKFIDGGIRDIGSTVGSHVGPGVVGIAFFEN